MKLTLIFIFFIFCFIQVEFTSAQLLISNPREIIQTLKVKDVIIYHINLTDSQKNEKIYSTLSYDLYGRHVLSQTVFGNKLGIAKCKYFEQTYDCIEMEIVSDVSSGVIRKESDSELINCQDVIFSPATNKATRIYAANGLLSMIIGYSLQVKEGLHLYSVIDTDLPQFVFRFQYTYY